MIFREPYRHSSIAKTAGNASMFTSLYDTPLFNIGKKNVAAVREPSLEIGVLIIADNADKDYSRTYYYYTEDGKMRVKSIKGKRIL